MPDSDLDVLERRCRRLLLAYPAGYRAERGPEILATMLDNAGPGQRRPHPAEAVDVIGSGLVKRSRIDAAAGLTQGLTTAAAPALALAAGISAFLWWRVEPTVAPFDSGQWWPFDGVVTVGPVAYLAWMLAALASATSRPAVGRLAITVAIVVTVLVVPVLGATPLGHRPPLWVLMALAGFGAIALAGTAPSIGAADATIDTRLTGLACAVAVTACASTVDQVWTAATPAGHTDYYGPTLARVSAVVVATVAAVAVVAAVGFLRGQPASAWLWTAALLGLPAGWLGPFSLSTPSLASSEPHFSRLAQVLFGTCVAVAVMYRLARPPVRATRSGGAGLVRAGWHTVGTAVGLATWIGLARFGTGSGPADAPGYVVATLVVLTLIGLTAAVPGAAVTGSGRQARGWRPLLAAAGLTVASAWLIAAYVNDGTLRGWDEFGHTAAVAAALAMVPLTECVITAARVRRAGAGRWVVLIGALGWLAVLAAQYLPGWGPPLLSAAACVAASMIAGRRRQLTRR